jgi:RNA polymerase sigma-70 factor (ECF subfamily)
MPQRPYFALITQAQNGDPVAMNDLLAAAQPDIRRYARSACAAADIDDAVQDALCLVHRNVGSLRAATAFAAWISAIVIRECLRIARKARGIVTPIDSLDDDLRLSQRPDHELRLDLTAAISSLPPHYRELIVLRDMEELTINEIATRLATTRATIKARLHRARALVREYLERD